MQYLNQLSGWLCLDKPEGISSNFAMVKVRRILEEKTGYIGTLDPFASGVLPIAVGEARKFIQYTNESEKKYTFTIVFGKTTDTLDRNGQIIAETSVVPSVEQVKGVILSFLGTITQVPPMFSAIKINGVRACDRARKGEKIDLKSREVHIFDLRIVEDNLASAEITLEVACSKGTYVRSLARDIAEKLGSLSYVKELRRTKAGFFSINNAITLEKLIEMKDTSKLTGVLYPLESPLDDIPALYVKEEEAVKLQRGLCISVEQEEPTSSVVKIFGNETRKFYGVGRLSEHGVVNAVRMCVDEANKE
ncbi:MAG: tRNA pseudouridine(55) synthase TruB [Alphaproteobacteria bacterium]|nr:tRNA pseudouridine(55) synthase TruB [Alphaproteobacteria bacterium]